MAESLPQAALEALVDGTKLSGIGLIVGSSRRPSPLAATQLAADAPPTYDRHLRLEPLLGRPLCPGATLRLLGDEGAARSDPAGDARAHPGWVTACHQSARYFD
jgi:hypothetical protein